MKIKIIETMKIKITEITEWREDSGLVAGDASHEGDVAVMRLLAEEREAKVYSDAWRQKAQGSVLPFEFDAKAETEKDAVEEALDAFTTSHCELDYLKPLECEYEVA